MSRQVLIVSLLAVDNEEAALLHEEATMTIEELLTRYGQNCHKGAPHGKSGTETDEEPGSQGLNGEAGPENPLKETSAKENGPTAKAHTGPSSNSDCGPAAGQGGEPGNPTGEAGPSCSSASEKLPRVAKSKFFEDSEDESDEAEEEEEDSEVRTCGAGTDSDGLLRGCHRFGLGPALLTPSKFLLNSSPPATQLPPPLPLALFAICSVTNQPSCSLPEFASLREQCDSGYSFGYWGDFFFDPVAWKVLLAGSSCLLQNFLF